MTEPDPLAEVMAGDVSADAGEGEGRVDPAAHRGHDVGILSRLFTALRERRDNDPTGPQPLPREDPDR